MTSDRNITATFAIDSFTVAVISNGNGTAQKSPNLSQHPYGSFVDLTGIPANGYHFTNWSGDTITTQNPYTVYVDHARSLAANFAINTYTVTSAFTGSGSIARIPDQPTYNHGTALRLVPIAAFGYKFSGWSGDTTATADTLDMIVTRDRSVSAAFTPDTHTLTLTAAPHGSVAKNPDLKIYDYATLVQPPRRPTRRITSRAGPATRRPPTTRLSIRMLRDRSLTGNFDLNTYPVTVTALGDGSVIRNPDQAQYPHGAVVTLTAVPAKNQTFTGWAGDTTGTTNPLSITVVKARSITAQFTATVNVTVVGNGTVTKQPDQTSYPLGSAVLLTANPAVGWHFVAWSGDTSTTTNPLTVPVTTTRNVTATFVINTYTLTINTVGNGSATATPSQKTYDHGTQVSLSSTAQPGNAFLGWTGDTTTSKPTVQLVMVGNRTVTANFTWQLAATATGPGTVSKTPDQPNYAPGTSVKLTATAGAHAHFVAWSGDTTATAPSLTVVMTATAPIWRRSPSTTSR
jgi:hypothetical protein